MVIPAGKHPSEMSAGRHSRLGGPSSRAGSHLFPGPECGAGMGLRAGGRIHGAIKVLPVRVACCIARRVTAAEAVVHVRHVGVGPGAPARLHAAAAAAPGHARGACTGCHRCISSHRRQMDSIGRHNQLHGLRQSTLPSQAGKA